MSLDARCPNCGQPLAANAGVDGLCAACLLRLAAVTGTGASFDDDPAATCRVLSVLGGTDHGSCYLADLPQGDARVLVVLKTIDCQAPADFEARVRSTRERMRALPPSTVAMLQDHGVTASGQPYFLFDYVRGIPIDAFCTRFNLSRDERVALTERVDAVCEAIHTAGLVHGSLSPTNILVAGTAAVPEPRVLDLGVRASLAPLLPCGDDAADWARLSRSIQHEDP
jgi:serine/threonine protein kinase